MNLNGDLLRTRCQEIAESLGRLERIKEESREKFLEDRDLQDVACYRLLVAIEAALALCYHVTAKRLKKVPEEYAECFAILAQAKIISPVLSEKLQKMARFRNLLVHMYGKVDYGMLYDIVQHNLNDLQEFSKAISVLL